MAEGQVNLNPDSQLTRKEKTGILIDSKTFTAIATLATLGLYYVYYLFCLEQEKDSPFVYSDNKRYDYERKDEENPIFIEASGIDRNICDLIEQKRIDKRGLEIEKYSNRAKLSALLTCSRFLDSCERTYMKSTGNDISLDSLEKIRYKNSKDFASHESKLKAFINRKLHEYSITPDMEFDLSNKLAISLSDQKIKPQKDHYLTFMFMFSYGLVSVLTLGLFPIYHLFIKKRWDDFKNIKKHKEHACTREFDNITEKLIGGTGNLEYSLLLLGNSNLPFNINFFADAFRTQVFKSSVIRKRLVMFFMVVTLGTFGLFVVGRNVFDKKKLSISAEDSMPTDYSHIEDKFEQFKLFILDLIRDINVGSKIAADRLGTINSSVNTLLIKENSNDRLMVKFLKIFSSNLYSWMFAFFYIFTTISIVTIYISWYPATFFLFFWFWVILGGGLCFWYLFSKHINLLFI